MRRSVVRVALFALLASPATAQQLARVWVPAPVAFAPARAALLRHPARSTVDDGNRIMGGLLGGTAGFFAGGFGGAAVAEGSSQSCQDFCGLGGFIIGAMVGESFGMVGGMAIAAPGTRAPDLLASLGIAAVGLGVAGLVHEPLTLVAIPVVQLVALVSLAHARTEGAPPAPD